MRVKIELNTMKDINKFVSICSRENSSIYLTDGNSLRVNAKSALGAMYSLEWSDLWCESEKDISGDIVEFIV